MLQIREINDFDELNALRPSWDHLLAKTPAANFFQTLDWLAVYWSFFGRKQKLRVLVASDEEGTVQGILPLVVITEYRKVGPVRILTYPNDDWGSYYGPLGDKPNATMHAAMRYLRRSRRDWHVMSLRWADPHSATAEATTSGMLGAGMACYESVREQTSLIDLNGTWDEYLSSRGSKWRNNYKRWLRRLEEKGEVTYERYRPAGATAGDADPRWDLWNDCQQVAQRSWQGSSRDGTTLCHDSVQPFLKEVHATAARVGCLDLNLLRVDGRPVAFAYNYQFCGSVYGLRAGYDPALGDCGVGNVLYGHAIRDSFERGDHQYDMGAGSREAKKRFRTELRDIMQYDHYRKSVLRAQMLRFKQRADQLLPPAAAGTCPTAA